ncbi:MAG: YeeE/YedE family protein [Polyangiales bacterium]
MDPTRLFTSLLGGMLIGLASAGVVIAQGRVAGVSGICGSLLRPVRGDIAWRVGFVSGLAAVGLVGNRLLPHAFSFAGVPSMPSVVVAGLLVGFGTRLSNGCTSGHGVCGISRFSRRSIIATLTFMATAALTVLLMRHVLVGVR